MFGLNDCKDVNLLSWDIPPAGADLAEEASPPATEHQTRITDVHASRRNSREHQSRLWDPSHRRSRLAAPPRQTSEILLVTAEIWVSL
jgi:hypothetical protein